MPINLAKPIKSASFSFSVVPDVGDIPPQQSGAAELTDNCAFMPMFFDSKSGLWHVNALGRCVEANGEKSPAVRF